jgi:hypothetical protein
MSRDAAKIVMDMAIKNAAEQDAILTQIQSLCTEDELSEYRRMIGRSWQPCYLRSSIQLLQNILS